jgi:hypothetical protein
MQAQHAKQAYYHRWTYVLLVPILDTSHTLGEFTSLITYIHNIISKISLLTWNLKEVSSHCLQLSDLHICHFLKIQSSSNCDIYGQTESHIATPTETSMAKYSINNFNCKYILGESNGKLSLRTSLEYSMPKPNRSPDWALVPAKTGPKAEY